MKYNDLISKSRFFNKEKSLTNKQLKIALVTTHNFPLLWVTNSGADFIVDLAEALDQLGHIVSLYTPQGIYRPKNGKTYSMSCSYGQDAPSSEVCEEICFFFHKESLLQQDIIHDFSITKKIAENLFKMGKRNIINTPLSSIWMYPNPPFNMTCHSNSMRERSLRGATDYENSPFPELDVPRMNPLLESHVVNIGINTDFYCPAKDKNDNFTYEKDDYILWLGRWHGVRGYAFAIEVAKRSGKKLIMAGAHPDYEHSDYHRKCCYQAISFGHDVPNIKFQWLPFGNGHHEAKRELYRRAKAYVFCPQFNEPGGISQLEVLACGTAVIGNNFGSVPEMIENDVTGIVVENHPDAFVWALSQIDKIDPKKCREQAVKRFDRSVMAKNYLKEYYSVINGNCWGI